jgi:phosphate-selective porin OprO/OprP
MENKSHKTMVHMKTGKIKFWIKVLLLSVIGFAAQCQDLTKNKFGKGLSILAQDSSFSLKVGVRVQTLFQSDRDLETGSHEDKLLNRRVRLRLEGFIHSPKLTYKIQVGLSSSDIVGGNIKQTGYNPNIIRDAVVRYNFYRGWNILFGQTKVPGNIERITSSQQLQFVDRNNSSAQYNLDRDAGVQLHYYGDKLKFYSSVCSGEGRNLSVNNSGGYDYTQRLEWYPLGLFTDNTEYSGADLKREKSLKVMIGVVYDYNDQASRERGQLGSYLTQRRTLKSTIIDAHIKYAGFSSLVEYIDKKAVDGSVILDDNGTYVESFYVGTGFNWQAGYLFKKNVEIALRYTNVDPARETQRAENTQYTFCVSKYIVGHSLKIQSDVTFIREAGKPDLLMNRVQVQFAL